ncbi:MAG: OmpA family protein, partial [Bacteroidota bacterium]
GFGGYDIFYSNGMIVSNYGSIINSSMDDYSISFIDNSMGYISSNRNGKNGDDLLMFEMLKTQRMVDFNFVTPSKDGFVIIKNGTGKESKKYIDNEQFSGLFDMNKTYELLFETSTDPLLLSFIDGQPCISHTNNMQINAKCKDYCKSKISDYETMGSVDVYKNITSSREYANEERRSDQAFMYCDVGPVHAGDPIIVKNIETGVVYAAAIQDNGILEVGVKDGDPYQVLSEDGRTLLYQHGELEEMGMAFYSEAKASPTQVMMGMVASSVEITNTTETSDNPKTTDLAIMESEDLSLMTADSGHSIPDLVKSAVDTSDPFTSEDQNSSPPGTFMKLNSIYFGYNQSNVSESHVNELMTIAEKLKRNPATFLEIQAHTDSRGSKSYNEALSKRRAIATKEALLALGVQDSQVRIQWHGEEQTMNGCTDQYVCEEDLHKMNRRAELSLFIPEDYAMN